MAINLLHTCMYALLNLISHVGYCMWMMVSVISCICSALCKELGITAAAICLAWDIIIIQKV